MQGIWINPVAEGNFRRPKSKKEIRELVTLGLLDRINVEATSLFGNDEFGGTLANAPTGRIDFVGPDPYVKRSFYGSITVAGDKVTVK